MPDNFLLTSMVKNAPTIMYNYCAPIRKNAPKLFLKGEFQVNFNFHSLPTVLKIPLNCNVLCWY